MTKNWEVFDRDPRGWDIPNQGVSKIGRPDDQGDWDVLRWELSSFVCEGEYERGLERILDQFLGHLSQDEQPAVWVSVPPRADAEGAPITGMGPRGPSRWASDPT